MVSRLGFHKCEAVALGSGSDVVDLQMGRHTAHHGAEKACYITPYGVRWKEDLDEPWTTPRMLSEQVEKR